MRLTFFILGVSARFLGKRAYSSDGNLLPPSQDEWYRATKNLDQVPPGTVLRIRTAPGGLAKTYNASAAYNLLYATTDSRYNASYAVTTLFVPQGGNGSKLLSYQIPYDTADVDYSPSFTLGSAAVPDITSALKMGWYVASPDYEGPLASFTAGVQSGHATIDGVRAVLNAGLGLENASYALWGYSGGALASEWAAELQVQYAPELKFAGAALGGLTPNVTSVLESVNGGFEAGLIPAGILGLSSQYPEYMADLVAALKPENRTAFLAAKNESLVGAIGAFLNKNIRDYFSDGGDILFGKEATYITNRDGIMGYHGVPQMPIFAYKAIADEVSRVADTDALISRYCAVGANILLQRNTLTTHTTESSESARAMYFLARVLNGTWSHDGCTNQTVSVQNNNVTTLAY